MIVILVFTAGVVFGAMVVGLVMLGEDRKRRHARAERVAAGRARAWDFPPPPCEDGETA